MAVCRLLSGTYGGNLSAVSGLVASTTNLADFLLKIAVHWNMLVPTVPCSLLLPSSVRRLGIKWEHQVAPKLRYLHINPHGVMSRKSGISRNVVGSYTGCSRTLGCYCYTETFWKTNGQGNKIKNSQHYS